MTTIKLEPSVLSEIHDMQLSNVEALPSTEQLLTEGGDARIVLDAVSGVNKYGCSPLPDSGMVALGSSTASIISAEGFAAADRLRNRLQHAAATESPIAIYTTELNRIRRELVRLCGVSDGSGIDVVFAASGTDIHLIAAQAFGSGETTSPLVIMVDPNETGSGVAALKWSVSHCATPTAWRARPLRSTPILKHWRAKQLPTDGVSCSY
jgi:hypothetical protein